MSYCEYGECPTCGGDITLRPMFYPQGFYVPTGRCSNCGNLLTRPSKEVYDREDYDNGCLAADKFREYERELAEANRAFINTIRPIGKPANGDCTHRCETCVHYSFKGGFGFSGSGEAIYCAQAKQFLVNLRAQKIKNTENDCADWCPVIEEVKA